MARSNVKSPSILMTEHSLGETAVHAELYLLVPLTKAVQILKHLVYGAHPPNLAFKVKNLLPTDDRGFVSPTNTFSEISDSSPVPSKLLTHALPTYFNIIKMPSEMTVGIKLNHDSIRYLPHFPAHLQSLRGKCRRYVAYGTSQQKIFQYI